MMSTEQFNDPAQVEHDKRIHDFYHNYSYSHCTPDRNSVWQQVEERRGRGIVHAGYLWMGMTAFMFALSFSVWMYDQNVRPFIHPYFWISMFVASIIGTFWAVMIQHSDVSAEVSEAHQAIDRHNARRKLAKKEIADREARRKHSEHDQMPLPEIPITKAEIAAGEEMRRRWEERHAELNRQKTADIKTWEDKPKEPTPEPTTAYVGPTVRSVFESGEEGQPPFVYELDESEVLRVEAPQRDRYTEQIEARFANLEIPS